MTPWVDTRRLRIGMAQVNATVGDFAGNRNKILKAIDQAKALGVDLLTFPELAICGYPPEDLLFKPQFIAENLRSLEKVVEASSGISIVIGFVDAKILPKEKLERLVIEQLQSKVLTEENLEELVKLVNEELQSASSWLRERQDAVDAELKDIKARLSRLYEVLETGKLNLDDLAPRIRELKSRQDELSKVKIQIEAEAVAQGVEQVDTALVKAYAQDLRSLLEEADITERKAFLRSFIKRIEVNKGQATVHYNLPLPPDGKIKQELEVLPTVTLGGAEGTRTPALLRAKEALSQLSYSPTYRGIIATRSPVSNLLNAAEVIKWWR